MRRTGRPSSRATGRRTSQKGGGGSTKKKRGAAASARRANKYREAGACTAASAPAEVTQNRPGRALSYSATMDIMARRKRPLEEPSSHEVEELETSAAPNVERAEAAAEEVEYQEKAEESKVPIHGDLRVNKKEDHTFRFLSININGLRFWLHKNYKAEKLRFMLKAHRVDVMGLQEACINWSAFKCSKTLASLLRQGVDNIRSVHSNNTLPGEAEDIGYNQRGGTATVLRGELFNYYKDLGKDHTGLGR